MSENEAVKPPAQIKPPYFAYKTLKNYLEGLKDHEIPAVIDRSVMPNTMSGSGKSFVISALQFFGFIDEVGVPQEKLEKFIKLEGQQRAEKLRQILQESYSFLFDGLNIERATTRQAEQRFKDAGMSGETVRKAILFFQAAAKDAELKISPHIKPYQGGRTEGRRATRNITSAAETVNAATDEEQQTAQQSSGTTKTVNLKAGGKLTLIAEINLLELTGEDRKFVFNLIDELNNYESKTRSEEAKESDLNE